MPEFPIVQKLGGRAALAEHLIGRGLIGHPAALRMHIKRGVIPGDLARELMRLADARSIAYDATDFELPPAPAAAEAAA